MLVGPVIKWSGSKRLVASELAALVPAHCHYYEPFVGSGALIPHVRPNGGQISDIMPELMDLWRLIRDEPRALSKTYAAHWQQLQDLGHTYFYEVRRNFNSSRDAAALLFLSRTCVNGLIRFNSAGEFNNSLHHTRPGIAPHRLSRLIHEWSTYIQNLGIRTCDYRDTLALARPGDFVFLDPPYVGTRGRYKPAVFDYDALCLELRKLTARGVRWMLTLDGSAGARGYAAGAPTIPALHTTYVGTGHSPFTRLMRTSLDEVLETVHLNFDPVTKPLAGVD